MILFQSSKVFFNPIPPPLPRDHRLPFPAFLILAPLFYNVVSAALPIPATSSIVFFTLLF